MINVKLKLRTVFLSVVLPSCVCLSARAFAEDAIPARSVHFVLEDEPIVVELSENSQLKTDLHYAAIVRGFAPLLLSETAQGGNSSRVPLNAFWLFQLATLDSSGAGKRLRDKWLPMTSGDVDPFRSTVVEYRQPGLDPARVPHVAVNGNWEGIRQFLANPSKTWAPQSRFWNQFTPAREMARTPMQQYSLLAPSVEDAKQFAQDFLHTYDEAFVPQLRKFVQDQKVALGKSREVAQPELVELDKKIADAGDVEHTEELSDQAISDLKVKRTLLKVELSGVRARISTIEKKLKESAKENWAVELENKLADLKVSAEIDLASVAAQQKVLDELIDGQKRLMQVGQLQQRRRSQVAAIETAAEGLARCEEILADLKPFELIDETVVIRPVRFRME